MEDNFSRDQRVGDGLGLIQAHDMLCALTSIIITSALSQIIRNY